MASQRNRPVALASRIVPDINETIIISSGNKSAILGEVYIVYVTAISSVRENTIYEPSKFGVISCPCCTYSI
jgi:hypothetical protein